MALDPNIALGVRGIEVPNPVAQYAQMAQLQNMQTQNQLHQMQMREAEATSQERNALRQLNPMSPDYEAQLFRLNPQLGISYRKEAATTAAQKAAEIKSITETAAAKQKMLGQAYRDISSRPSDANITAHLEDIADSPLYDAAEKAAITKRATSLLALPFADRQMYLAQQGASASELKPSVQSVDQYGQKRLLSVPAFGGAPTTIGTYEDVPLPGPVQNQKIQIAQQSRPPAQPVAPTVTQIVDPTNPTQMISVDARRYQGGGVGSPGVIGVGGKEPGAGSMKPLTEGQTIKLRTDVSKDYKAATTALSQMEDLLESIDKVKTAPGLAAATGFTGKYLPSFPEGKAAQAETRLANLRGKVTALGKATAAMSGAIGSIANQEWKILSDQIAVLDEVKGKGPLVEQIELVEQQARGAIERIRDTYEKTRAEDFERFPQFRDLPAPRTPAGASNVVITPDGQSHTFPTPAAAAQFKKAAGI
jgi:hypothetical protein